MGSLGWCECYWCQKMVLNPYISDWVGQPLCGDCTDLLLVQERPPYPDARDRATQLLRHWFQALPENALVSMAEFLVDWSEP